MFIENSNWRTMSVGEIINITDLLGGRVRIEEESIQGVSMNNSILKYFKSSTVSSL